MASDAIRPMRFPPPPLKKKKKRKEKEIHYRPKRPSNEIDWFRVDFSYNGGTRRDKKQQQQKQQQRQEKKKLGNHWEIAFGDVSNRSEMELVLFFLFFFWPAIPSGYRPIAPFSK